MKIFTVGYEGLDIEEFLEGLKKRKIQWIADIRKNPVSRKKGFSKNKLATHLHDVGISYLPLAKLGVPTEWRKQAKAGKITRSKMFKDYARKILPLLQKDIVDLESLAKKKKVALLCFECDAMDCHRSFLTQEMQKHIPDLEVINLEIKPGPKILTASFSTRKK